MTYRTWLGACVAVVLAVGVASAEQGVVRGTVASVIPFQTEDGRTLYALTLRGEGPWQAILTVAPENKEACAQVAGLRPGERVVVGWTSEGGRTWVRELVRDGAGGRPEGERREGERREGDGQVRGDREKGEGGPRVEADRPKVVKEERPRGELDERAWQEAREREARESLKNKERKERAERERRDGEGVKPGPRDGDRREGEGVKPGPRDGDRREGERREGEGVKPAPRDGEGEKPGPRDGERIREGPRDGERREGERREGVAPGRMTTTARVLGVETRDENTRVLKLAAVEGGEETAFTVTAAQRELYDLVGALRPGATVRVQWRTERGTPVLTNVTRVGEER